MMKIVIEAVGADAVLITRLLGTHLVVKTSIGKTLSPAPVPTPPQKPAPAPKPAPKPKPWERNFSHLIPLRKKGDAKSDEIRQKSWSTRTCSVCGKRFRTAKKLARHQKRHEKRV